jgi:hypothetical protein
MIIIVAKRLSLLGLKLKNTITEFTELFLPQYLEEKNWL